ncbi:MAG: transaldolase family protein [Candidatus Cyclobacteriaceae bacterium M3_2C_046]
MKIFLDTADVESIRKAYDTGLVDGITTNPSKILQSGKRFTDVLKEICQIVSGPVSAEAVADQTDQIIEEAQEIAAISSNINIKVPLTPEGLKAGAALEKQGIRTNVTMIFSPDQLLLAMKTRAFLVSIVLSRLDKIGGDVKGFIEDAMTIKRHYEFESQVLAASIKTRKDAIDCMRAGVDIISIPEDIFFNMFYHPQTVQGLAEFDLAWSKIIK